MEKIIFYLLAFFTGTVFGSFFTLAVYRIPLHQDITHKRSYCPNCKHKLSFWDMIPIFSYLFLGGKCRYCKQKIRSRYLWLEVATGCIFLLFAMSLNISWQPLQTYKLIYLLFAICYLSGIIIIAGIEKERHTIQKSVLLYEIGVVTLYMVYLYTVEKANIYRYAIYLFFLILLIILENTYLKKKLQSSYPLEILELSIIMAIFTGEILYISSVILTLLTIAIKQLGTNCFQKTKITYYKNIPFGFYLVCSNILLLILVNGIACRW